MEFINAFETIAPLLKKVGSDLNQNDYDGLIVKRLEPSNTLDKGRTTKQSHIAITGAQMDMFPYVRADGYFEVEYEDEDPKLKKYFVAQIPVYLHRENVEYLDPEEELFSEKERLVHVSIVRSRRKNAADQIQMSMTYMDSPEYVKYRRIVHAGSYMIMLKRSSILKYDIYCVKQEDAENGEYNLKALNNVFCKKATNTVVKLDEIMIAEKEQNESFTPEWFQSKAAEFPSFDEEAETRRKQFLEKYAPDKLRELEGMDLLRTVFLNDQNKDNLCYELEFDGKMRELFGSIKSGTAYKYGLHYSKKNGGWATGASRSTQLLTEEEAIELGTQIRDYLVDGADILSKYEKIETLDGYGNLYKELNAVTEGYVNRVWFLKYYHMIAPELFPPIYSQNAQTTVLTAIGENPDDNSVVRMGQMQLFVQKCGISSVLFSRIFWSYYSEQTADDEEEDVIAEIDASDNEEKFRTWMAGQVTVNGTAPSPSMISNNCSALKKVCQLMDIIEYPDIQSIFEITDIDTFVDIKDIIKGHHDYDEVNKACNNRFLSTALNWYEKYLNEIQAVEEEEEVVETPDPYSKEAFLEKVFLTPEEYDKLYKLLLYKKNVILQGAPGVGKTFLAKRFAYSIIGAKDDRYIELIQFHQNYSYEDFIMGYKPTDDSFELKTGVFYNFCKKAAKDKDHKYFFIIDEINRGNLSKIFGELMMLIEGDKRGKDNCLTLAYRNEKFYVPENVYLIGMMNTADRSLAMMDYALRRRFSFFDVEPAFGKPQFKEYLKGYISDPAVVSKVISRFTDLNKKIADEENSGLGKGFCIGHSYFCNPPVEGQTDQEWYDTIIEFEVSPLLDEYWWDDKNKAEDCKKELMKD